MLDNPHQYPTPMWSLVPQESDLGLITERRNSRCRSARMGRQLLASGLPCRKSATTEERWVGIRVTRSSLHMGQLVNPLSIRAIFGAGHSSQTYNSLLFRCDARYEDMSAFSPPGTRMAILMPQPSTKKSTEPAKQQVRVGRTGHFWRHCTTNL